MIITERKNLPLGIGDDCSRFIDSSYYNPGQLNYGIVTEVGDESFVVQWQGVEKESEYEWQKVSIIGRHIYESKS